MKRASTFVASLLSWLLLAHPSASLGVEVAEDHVGSVAEALYLSEVRETIERHRKYPSAARLRHEQGVTEVAFTIHRSGSISDLRVVKPGSSSDLDGAALAAVKGARHFKKVPKDVSSDDIEVVVPIDFKIDN